MNAKNILAILLLCFVVIILAVWVSKSKEVAIGDDPTGTYIAFTSTPSLTTQTILLHVEGDFARSAIMTEDDQNNQAPLVKKGTWAHEGGGNISVSFGSDPELLFSIESDALVLWHDPGERDLVLSHAVLPLESEWRWIETLLNDGTTTAPTIERPFILRLSADARLTVTGDCNDISGSFSLREGAWVIFGPLLSTKMFCEGSFEGSFLDGLSSAESYTVKDDVLTLKLKDSAGLMTFERYRGVPVQ